MATLQQISDNIVAQMETSLGQTVPLLPKTFIRVLAKTLAGVFILLYKYAGWSSLQLFIRTAQYSDTEINGIIVNPLKWWGELVGVGDRTNATQAELVIDISVVNQVGSLPSGTQLLSSATGITYITLSSVLLDAATVQATVRAVSDQTGGTGAGTIGNLDPGAELSFANPLGDVQRTAIVASQAVTAADSEAIEVYRQRVQDRWQKPPRGGSYSDYEIWGEEVAGIINVYPYTSSCPGEVDVYSEATEASSGSPDGIPTAAQLTAVFDSINQSNRRPVGAAVNSLPIERTPFDININGLISSDPGTVQSDITLAIQEYFRAREPHIPGLSVPPRRDQITNSAVSGVVDDVVSAAGDLFESVRIERSGTTINAYTLSEGEKTKADTVTFT